MNHGTVDRTFDQGAGRPSSWTESWPVASAMGICTERRDTVLTFPNVFGPIAGDYEVRTDVHAADGSHRGTRVTLVAGGRARPVLAARRTAGVGGRVAGQRPRRGHREGRSTTCPSPPPWIDILVGIVDDGDLVGEVQVGGEFFNRAIPDGVAMPDIRRTRTFGRVDVRPAIDDLAVPGQPGRARRATTSPPTPC